MLQIMCNRIAQICKTRVIQHSTIWTKLLSRFSEEAGHC